MILGIDEVGRGPWAGPLLVGAVIWPDDIKLEGLTDSKKLTAKKRELLNDEIIKLALGFGIGEVSSSEIDEIGLSKSLRLATKRAVDEVKRNFAQVKFDQIIIDGTINFLKDTEYENKVSTLAKADFLVPAVSAASIIAKVKRDNFMKELATKFPQYGFDTNVGYGTKKHIDAINEFGVTPFHRLSFAPLAKYRPPIVEKNVATTKQIGDKAENAVAKCLKKEGHIILRRNYKTKWYEIDIISFKNKTIFFTEVKYRKNSDFGGAESAVNKIKQDQMKYAAELFMRSGNIKAKNINDYSPILAVGLVSGNYKVEDWFTLN